MKKHGPSEIIPNVFVDFVLNILVCWLNGDRSPVDRARLYPSILQEIHSTLFGVVVTIPGGGGYWVPKPHWLSLLVHIWLHEEIVLFKSVSNRRKCKPPGIHEGLQLLQLLYPNRGMEFRTHEVVSNM